MSMAGRMSLFIRLAESQPPIMTSRQRIAMVYGRRSARRTIHIKVCHPMPEGRRRFGRSRECQPYMLASARARTLVARVRGTSPQPAAASRVGRGWRIGFSDLGGLAPPSHFAAGPCALGHLGEQRVEIERL